MLADAFHDESYITGWVIADEVSEDYLWGIAVAADALRRADPTKLPIMNHFGIDRMLQCLRDDRDAPAEKMIGNLQQAVDDFSAGIPQGDDITAIAIKREL